MLAGGLGAADTVDAAGRPYAGVYRSGGASATAFGIVATDRGDVVALTDVSGAAFAGYRYDTWGKVMSASTQAVAGSLSATLAADIASRQPLRYAGYCYDAESSTYYLSARQYDPMTRQFLTKDPAKADGEESAYQYCGGDPVGKVDPSGLHKSVLGTHWHLRGIFTWPYYTPARWQYASRVHNGLYQVRRRLYTWVGYNAVVPILGGSWIPGVASTVLGYAAYSIESEYAFHADGNKWLGYRYTMAAGPWGKWYRP